MQHEDMKTKLERVSQELRDGDEHNRLLDVEGSAPWCGLQRSGVWAVIVLIGALCIGVAYLVWPLGLAMALGLVKHVYDEERRITAATSAYNYSEAARRCRGDGA